MRSNSSARRGHSCTSGSCPHPMPKSGASSLRIFVAAFVVLGMSGFGVWGAVSNAAPSKAAQKFAVKSASGITVRAVSEEQHVEESEPSSNLFLHAFDYTNATQNPVSINAFAFSAASCGVQELTLASGPEEDASLITGDSTRATSAQKDTYVFSGTNVVIGPRQTKRVWLHRNNGSSETADETAECAFVVETDPAQTIAVDSVTGRDVLVGASRRVPTTKVRKAQ